MIESLLWDGLRQVYTAQEKKMDEARAMEFVQNLQPYLYGGTASTLLGAILEGDIGTEDNKTTGLYKGVFLKRVQSFLWKTYEFQFNERSNILNIAMNKATQDVITHDLFGEIDWTNFLWKPGQFGDKGSCFFSDRAIARYYMKNNPNFGAFKLFKKLDGPPDNLTKQEAKIEIQNDTYYVGYGRAWVIKNFPEKGMITLFNPYPGKDEITLFGSMLLQGLIADSNISSQELSITKRILLNLDSGTGWLYINHSTCCVIGPADRLSSLPEELDLQIEETPKAENFPEWFGHCDSQNCVNPVWEDDPGLISSSIIPTHKSVLKFCKRCWANKRTRHGTKCSSCKEHTVWLGAQDAHFDMSGKKLTHKKNGSMILVCNKCFLDGNFDQDNYASELKDIIDKFKTNTEDNSISDTEVQIALSSTLDHPNNDDDENNGILVLNEDEYEDEDEDEEEEYEYEEEEEYVN